MQWQKAIKPLQLGHRPSMSSFVRTGSVRAERASSEHVMCKQLERVDVGSCACAALNRASLRVHEHCDLNHIGGAVSPQLLRQQSDGTCISECSGNQANEAAAAQLGIIAHHCKQLSTILSNSMLNLSRCTQNAMCPAQRAKKEQMDTLWPAKERWG